LIKTEQKRDPDIVADYPCLYVSEWICPIHVPDIPLEVCQVCIQARRLNMEQNSLKQQTGTAPAFQRSVKPPVQRLTPQREEVEQKTPEEQLKRRARVLLNRYIENLKENLETLEKEEPVEEEERKLETEETGEENALLTSFKSLSLQLSELEKGLSNLLGLIEKLRRSLGIEERKTRTVY
jgi:hypothetical protein